MLLLISSLVIMNGQLLDWKLQYIYQFSNTKEVSKTFWYLSQDITTQFRSLTRNWNNNEYISMGNLVCMRPKVHNNKIVTIIISCYIDVYLMFAITWICVGVCFMFVLCLTHNYSVLYLSHVLSVSTSWSSGGFLMFSSLSSCCFLKDTLLISHSL